MAESKLDTISDHISRALKENVIGDEFSMILDEVEKYRALKGQIQVRVACVIVEQQKMDQAERESLVKQGRDEARSEFVKALPVK